MTELGAAIDGLVANPASSTIQAQVLTLLHAILAALNSPCLASATGALTSARAQIAAADANLMPAALANLSTALAGLSAALASPCEFPFDFSLLPNAGIAQPNVPATFKLFLQNKSLVPVTYDLSLSGLPAGVSGGLNTSTVTLQPGQTIPAGDSSDPAVTLTQTNDITSFQFTVTAAVDGIANSGKNAEGTLTARNQVIYVQQVSANPAFISPGDTTSVSASIANAVNETLNVNVGLAVVNASGVTVLNVPPQSAQLTTQSLLSSVDFGTIATQSLPAGSYTLQVAVSDATTGQPIPGGSGAGVLVIGSPLSASLTVAPQFVPPGNSTVTTTLTVNGGGASLSNPLVLLGTQPTASSANSIALDGNLAYICDNNEVTIMDLTNPAQATTLGTALSGAIKNSGIVSCSVQRDTLVAFSSPINSSIGSNFAFSAFSLANPEQPSLIAVTPTSQRFFQKPVYIGNLAFVPSTFNSFIVGVFFFAQTGDLVSYDLTNFAAPKLISSLRPGQDNTSILGATEVNSNTLYIGGGTGSGAFNGLGRLQVIDITNPAAMQTVAELHIPGSALFNAPLIQGNVAVGMGVSGGWNGQFSPPDGNFEFGNVVIATFDITNPTSPTILSSTTTSFLSGPGGGAAQIGPNLFLFGGVKDSANNPLLLLVDITNPSAPTFKTFPVVAPIHDMVAQGTTLFTASGNSGFAAYLIPGTNASNFTAQVQVPKGTGVAYDPASFNVPPVVTPGDTFDTLAWANPRQSTVTWNSSVAGMHAGEVRNVALGGNVSFNGPAGAGSVPLAPVSVTANQILDITPGTANVQAGMPSAYTLTVHNPTNATVTYDLAVTGISANWVTLPSSITVSAQGQTTVPLTIQTEASATPGSYAFVVSASISSVVQGTVQASFALSGPGSAGAGSDGSSTANGIATVLTPATATAGQGTTASFTLQVSNTGNVADTFALSAVVPAGVTASFDRSLIAVEPGLSNSQQVHLTLAVMPGTAPSISSFTVTAVSQTISTVTSQQVGTLTISASGVSVVLDPATTTPGGTLQATITNLGSAPDIFTLTLNGPGALITTPSQNAISLDPGASESVTLTVGAAPFATLGTLPLFAIATSQSDPAVSANASGGITIPASLGVSAAFDPPDRQLPGPGQATFLLQVQNTGTIEDAYSATISSTSGPLTAALTGLDGQPTQSIAQFRLPALSSGELVLTAADNAFGIGTATVTIASLSNPAITSTVTATLRTPTPPTADAGQGQTIPVGLSSRLDGSASADTNTPALPLSYQWTLLSAPQGSGLTSDSLRLSSAVRASFTPDVPGTYVFQLAVTNVAGTATAIVSFQAQDAAPIAKAGRAQNVRTGSIVTLDGRGSFDPDGSLITYLWQFVSVPAGSTVANSALYDSLTPAPFFRPDVDGTYHLRLVVADAQQTSAPDFVDITAFSGNIAPNADAGPDQYASPLSVVTLDGNSSSDPDNGPQPLAYLWALQNVPAASALTNSSISGSSSPNPQFVPDVPGDYALSLSVSDGQLTSTSSVIVHVVSINLPPLADAGANQQIVTGAAASMDGSHSSDPDAGPGSLSYFWHLSSIAPNSQLLSSSIAGASTATPSFTPDQPGNYVIRLAANDGLDESYANTSVAASATCDADHDGYITLNDIDLIQASLGRAVNTSDSRDFDHDGVITSADFNGCAVHVPETVLNVAPRALSFYSERTQTLVVTASSGSPTYTATTNQPWISVTPTQSNTAANPVLVVTVSPSGLAFGTYEGAIVITASNGGSVTVPVMMNVPMLPPPTSPGDACLYALNQSAANAFQLIGSVAVNLSCGIVSDSGSSSALSFTGSGSLKATDVQVVGGVQVSTSASISPAPLTLAAFQPDPFAFLVPLNSDVCDQTNFTAKGNTAITLNPGTYCNGITISGGSSVTFNPGTYILMGGGLSVAGSSLVSGSGVTFFLTQGLGYKFAPLSIDGTVTTALTPPNDGSMEGILFFQDPRVGYGQPASSIRGAVTSTLEGVMYFPTTELQYSGSGSTGRFLIIVADTVSVNGSIVINNDFSGLTHGSPLKRLKP